MIIRPYEPRDMPEIGYLHSKSGLDLRCLPDLSNALYFLKLVGVEGDRISMFGSLKLTTEAFILLDHDAGTPEERWENLKQLMHRGLMDASEKGIQDVTCWLPPALESSFSRRISELGFHRSAWNSYSAILS